MNRAGCRVTAAQVEGEHSVGRERDGSYAVARKRCHGDGGGNRGSVRSDGLHPVVVHVRGVGAGIGCPDGIAHGGDRGEGAIHGVTAGQDVAGCPRDLVPTQGDAAIDHVRGPERGGARDGAVGGIGGGRRRGVRRIRRRIGGVSGRVGWLRGGDNRRHLDPVDVTVAADANRELAVGHRGAPGLLGDSPQGRDGAGCRSLEGH